jgi:hypothetical protein
MGHCLCVGLTAIAARNRDGRVLFWTSLDRQGLNTPQMLLSRG